MTAKVTEARLSALWQDGGLVGKRLLTAEGQAIRIMDQGRPGDGRGPDFLNAVVSWDRGVVRRGDVELHTHVQAWRQHGHHHDPRYNAVILHVVFRNQPPVSTMSQAGWTVPVVALEDGPGESLLWTVAAPRQFPCQDRAHCMDVTQLRRLLSRLGDAWFRRKVCDFGEMVRRHGAGQAMYQGIMRALGYTRNQEAASELARRLPLRTLCSVTRRVDREALLLGAAGLLPSQRRLPCPREDRAIQMEESWLRLGRETPMSAAQWDLFRVRPENHPARRLAAMAGLLETFPLGLEQGILAVVRRAIREGCSVLEEGLLVPASGYWAGHRDFGLPAAPAALLGRGRASQIVINVALPFAGASEQYGQDADLGRAAAQLFRAYPRLEPDRVTREMESKLRGCAGAPRIGARHQQGMHYLYRQFCQRGRCPACPAVTPG